MSGVDIASLVEAGKDPKTADSISAMLKSVADNLSYVDKIMGTLQKMGVSPNILEKVIIKYAELDKVPDLPGGARGIVPVSNNHRAVFETLNNLSEAELIQLSKDMEVAKAKK